MISKRGGECMKQDRKTNGWIVIGSIVELILGFFLIIAGGATALGGFFYIEKLNKLTDLQYFINQKWIKYVIDKFKLTPKFTYMYLGIAIAVIGIATLIFAIVSLNYAKKHKVVRRRVALLLYMLLALGVAGCAVAYFVFEKDNLPNNIKYVLYGAMGAYGFVGLCKLLGVMFGRSETFMSNDNSKYAQNNRLIQQQIQQPRPVQVQGGMVTQQRVGVQAQGNARPVSTHNGTERPMQANPNAQPRPVSQNPNMEQRQIQQGARPMQGQSRPMPNNQGMTQPRPMNVNGQPRPMGQSNVQSAQARPQSAQGMTNRPTSAQRPTQPTGRNYCPKCGKLLLPNEKVCSMCGYRVTE